MKQRWRHVAVGLVYLAGWCALAPVCAYLADRARRELGAAQHGTPQWGRVMTAAYRWRQTRPRPIVTPAPQPEPQIESADEAV